MQIVKRIIEITAACGIAILSIPFIACCIAIMELNDVMKREDK